MPISQDASVDVEKFRPLGDWIVLLKCANDHVRDGKGRVLVTLTDKTLDHTNWVEIVAVGPKCKMFHVEDIGQLTICPDFAHDLRDMGAVMGDGYWMIRETDRGGEPNLKPLVYRS